MDPHDTVRLVSLTVACAAPLPEDFDLQTLASMVAAGSAHLLSAPVVRVASALGAVSAEDCDAASLLWLNSAAWAPATADAHRVLCAARELDALGRAPLAARGLYAAACALEPGNRGAWFSALWCTAPAMSAYGELVESAERALTLSGASAQELFDYVYAPEIAVRLHHCDFQRAGMALRKCAALRNEIGIGVHPGITLDVLMDEYKSRRDEYRDVRTVPWGTPFEGGTRHSLLTIKTDKPVKTWTHARVSSIEESFIEFYCDVYESHKKESYTSGTIVYSHAKLSQAVYGQGTDTSWTEDVWYGDLFEIAVLEDDSVIAHRYPREVIPLDICRNAAAWRADLWLDPHRFLYNYKTRGSIHDVSGDTWAKALREYGRVELADGRVLDQSVLTGMDKEG